MCSCEFIVVSELSVNGISKCPLLVELMCGGMLGGADSSPVLTYRDGIMYVVSLGLFQVLSMLQIYYLARGRQFVSAYALSMLSVVNQLLYLNNHLIVDL